AAAARSNVEPAPTAPAMAVNPAFFRNARRPNPSVWDMRLLPLISEQFEVPPVGDLRPQPAKYYNCSGLRSQPFSGDQDELASRWIDGDHRAMAGRVRPRVDRTALQSRHVLAVAHRAGRPAANEPPSLFVLLRFGDEHAAVAFPRRDIEEAGMRTERRRVPVR